MCAIQSAQIAGISTPVWRKLLDDEQSLHILQALFVFRGSSKKEYIRNAMRAIVIPEVTAAMNGPSRPHHKFGICQSIS